MIKLIQGDCIVAMRNLYAEQGCCVDMVLTDLPYGTTACKWDNIIPFEPMWDCLSYLCEDNAAKVFTSSQPFTSALVMSNPKQFKCEWIWKKNAGSNFGSVRFQPMKEHESVLVFGKGKTTYNPQMQERAPSGASRVKTNVNYNTKTDVYASSLHGKVTSKRPDLRYPSSLQYFNRERGLHPTQKPVALMEYLIKTYTNEGDTVLDFTMGSGTTGVACKNLNRDFIGIEMDSDYFSIAKGRIESD